MTHFDLLLGSFSFHPIPFPGSSPIQLLPPRRSYCRAIPTIIIFILFSITILHIIRIDTIDRSLQPIQQTIQRFTTHITEFDIIEAALNIPAVLGLEGEDAAKKRKKRKRNKKKKKGMKLTPEQLAQYDGTDPSKPIYLSFK